MDIHGSTFAAFLALGLSPTGLADAEQLILSTNQDPHQEAVIRWLFQCVRGSGTDKRPDAILPPADELYLEDLLSLIGHVNARKDKRTTNRTHRISARLDFLYFARNDRHWSPVKLINYFYRSNVVPTRRAAVVTSIRNEAANVLEWIAHHRAFGFEDFFFYVNESDDGTVELLEALAKGGVCHVILNETHLGRTGESAFPVQSKGLEHAIHLLAPLRDFRWVLFSDVDEFLVTKAIASQAVSNDPLNDLIQKIDRCPDTPRGVLFSWKWFGSNSAYSREDGLLFERFCNFVGSGHIKTFAQIGRCLAFPTPHLPHLVYGDRVLDGALDPVVKANHEMPAAYDYGQINHYWNKSFEEYVAKHLRGRGFRRFANFFEYGHNRTYGRFEQLPVRWIDRIRGELALLRSMPNVEVWQREAETRFHQSIERYDAQDELAALYLSERFGIRGEAQRATKAGSPPEVVRHVVAPAGRNLRWPLLRGTERFAAPWLKYWHERNDPPLIDDIACCTLMGVIVAGAGAIWHGEGRLAGTSFGSQDKTQQISRAEDGLPLRAIHAPCVVMTGHRGNSYARDVSEWMLRVGIARHTARSLNFPLRILLDATAPKWVGNLLRQVWGIAGDAIEVYHPDTERVLLSRAVIPTVAMSCYGAHPFLNELVDEMAASRKSYFATPKIARVFLTQQSSRQQTKRECLNEAELVELAIRRHGFIPVSVENLSWFGQIKLFSEADILVNNTDTELVSSIFCHPQCRFASLGFRTLLTSEIGSLRRIQNAYFTLGTESTSRYTVDQEAFSNFLDRVCD